MNQSLCRKAIKRTRGLPDGLRRMPRGATIILVRCTRLESPSVKELTL
jgi:hypothetical protein